jgi:hypothetical protein
MLVVLQVSFCIPSYLTFKGNDSDSTETLVTYEVDTSCGSLLKGVTNGEERERFYLMLSFHCRHYFE